MKYLCYVAIVYTRSYEIWRFSIFFYVSLNCQRQTNTRVSHYREKSTKNSIKFLISKHRQYSILLHHVPVCSIIFQPTFFNRYAINKFTQPKVDPSIGGARFKRCLVPIKSYLICDRVNSRNNGETRGREGAHVITLAETSSWSHVAPEKRARRSPSKNRTAKPERSHEHCLREK